MDKNEYSIATFGSHSALQILKGAKDEGFRTFLISVRERTKFYKRFSFIDEILSINSFSNFPSYEKKLKNENLILIPQGSFVSYLGLEGNKKIKIPYFGNKKILDWEADRNLQDKWFRDAKILAPKQFDLKGRINTPVIAKHHGAKGGAGYFFAANKNDLTRKTKKLSKRNFVIQEYIIGLPMYFHYFYSPLNKRLELLSIDRRYETNIDALGRLPLSFHRMVEIEPSFVVVGNSPLVVRESLLPKAYEMAERMIKSSKRLIDKRGLFGPFCLETIITPDQKIYVIEISARIVAGTNLYTNDSPYAPYFYDEPMSTGRRIAREIKLAIEKGKLDELVS